MKNFLSNIEKYNSAIAGTSIETLNPSGWEFQSFDSDVEIENGIEYHYCLTHRTAQYSFVLDNNLTVYVDDEEWVKIYDSVFNLVYLEKKFNEVLPKINHNKIKITPIGHYNSIDDFEKKNIEILSEYQTIKCDNEDLNALYYKDDEVISLGRFYDSENFSLYAMKYHL